MSHCELTKLDEKANKNALNEEIQRIIGSEFEKGSSARSSANSPKFKSHSNKHIIMRDFYQVNGSDASQIGWVEVSGEEGQNGYLWYLKAEGDTRARFSDYLEMTMLEAVKGIPGAASATGVGDSDFGF